MKLLILIFLFQTGLQAGIIDRNPFKKVVSDELVEKYEQVLELERNSTIVQSKIIKRKDSSQGTGIPSKVSCAEKRYLTKYEEEEKDGHLYIHAFLTKISECKTKSGLIAGSSIASSDVNYVLDIDSMKLLEKKLKYESVARDGFIYNLVSIFTSEYDYIDNGGHYYVELEYRY